MKSLSTLRLVPLTMYFTGFPMFSNKWEPDRWSKDKQVRTPDWQMCPPLEKGRRNVCIDKHHMHTEASRVNSRRKTRKRLMGREGQEAQEDNQGTTRAFTLHWNALIIASCNYVIFLYWTAIYSITGDRTAQQAKSLCSHTLTLIFIHEHLWHSPGTHRDTHGR